MRDIASLRAQEQRFLYTQEQREALEAKIQAALDKTHPVQRPENAA